MEVRLGAVLQPIGSGKGRPIWAIGTPWRLNWH